MGGLLKDMLCVSYYFLIRLIHFFEHLNKLNGAKLFNGLHWHHSARLQQNGDDLNQPLV